MLNTPLNLLLIEDEDDHHELIRRHLNRAANSSISLRRVARLSDGIEAIRNGEQFDAILTDLNLPDSNGLQTFRTVRKVANGTPLIALTSDAMSSEGIALMQEGADDFLTKSSLDSELLFRSIVCAVERRHRSEAEVRLHEQAGQMEIARQIQTSILPEALPQWPEMDIAATSHPADAVGGDYYDFIVLPNGDYLIAIGDATGHGPGAALIMAMAAASLRTLTAIFTDLGEITRRLNDLLVPETPAFTFMTFCLFRIDRAAQRISWTNAGHPPPVKLTHGSDTAFQFESIREHLPLGMIAGTKYFESGVALNNGDLMYAITDGITEAMDSASDLFTQQRLDDLARSHQSKSAAAVLAKIEEAVAAWRDGQPADDDETCIVMRWNSASED